MADDRLSSFLRGLPISGLTRLRRKIRERLLRMYPGHSLLFLVNGPIRPGLTQIILVSLAEQERRRKAGKAETDTSPV